MGGTVQHGGFMTEAAKLLEQGRPTLALNMLERFSGNPRVRELHEYWRMRAAAIFLAYGKKAESQALACLREVNVAGEPRPDREFFDLYVKAIRALAHRKTWWTWHKSWQHRMLVYNIDQAALFAEMLGENGASLKAELTALRPAS